MTDIRSYGAGDGVEFYWVRRFNGVGGKVSSYLALVTIDGVGGVTDTGTRQPDDDAAFNQGEAVMDHLAEGIKRADAALEKRRAKLPEPEPNPEPPTSPATERFFDDGD